MQFDPTQPLAILPEYTSQLVSLLRGEIPDQDRPTLRMLDQGGRETSDGRQQNLIAVVPIWGVLTPDGWSGTSLDDLARTVTALDHNSNVGAIVLNVTSPGGTVTGTPEAASAVRAVRDRGETKIVSVANGMAASAAMWISAAAETVYVTPSGEAGSIGVIAMYADWSKAYERYGVKVDVMRTPQKKARFTGVEPMTAEMREHVETRIAESYEKFKRAMATNRGIRIDQVESKFGGGEMLSAEQAVEAGLVDRIATLDQAIARLTSRKTHASARASLAKAML